MEKKLSEIWWEKGTETNTSLFITNAQWKETYDKILSIEAKIEFINYVIYESLLSNIYDDVMRDEKRQLESELQQIKEQEGL